MAKFIGHVYLSSLNEFEIEAESKKEAMDLLRSMAIDEEQAIENLRITDGDAYYVYEMKEEKDYVVTVYFNTLQHVSVKATSREEAKRKVQLSVDRDTFKYDLGEMRSHIIVDESENNFFAEEM